MKRRVTNIHFKALQLKNLISDRRKSTNLHPNFVNLNQIYDQ